ncbi:hypothetical protein H0H81_000010 [Sphagnurus paluster]|uniref:SHSP domain-containing protein n=1 Tax=Sphagnurus paluster TaxID=117069 RepID=A0A9P7G2L3_9AGAR|nr:hypothetical protein H0H81_000010 [Sphagnurus paluster]
MRIRRHDFERLVDRAVELRMMAKKSTLKKQRSYIQPRPSPQYLMPRLAVIDDKTQSRIVAQLEVPDVVSRNLKLELLGDKLMVSGMRQPCLDSVPTEYRRGFLQQTQTVVGGDQRPQFILLGGGRVMSAPAPLAAAPPRQSKSLKSEAVQQHQPTDENRPISMVFYNELRYGPFRRDLRPNDIEAALHNGMLVITWPRNPTTLVNTPCTPDSTPVMINIAPASQAHMTVKVESMED